MRLIILIYILLALIIPFTATAQSKREILNLELKAKEQFEKNKFYQALQSYLFLDRRDPHNHNYMFPIGVCYLNIYQHEKALPYLRECLKKPELHSSSLYYYAAKSYQLSYEFDSAITHYHNYKDLVPDKEKHRHLILDVIKEVESCKNAKEMIADPIHVKIHNLGSVINSIYPEYGALISADEETIIFTSDRPNTTGGHVYDLDGTFFEDIYISYKSDSGWSKPVGMGQNINTWHHDASVALSHDGHKLLLYRYSTDHLLHKSGDLYISEFKNGEWGKAVHLDGAINSKNWEPSACFSLDDKTIYFTSDRKGGFGGTDIYMIKQREDGSWEEPINLGSKINTPYNEDGPYLHPDGIHLYFTSEGHKGMGGYDIFVSEWNKQEKIWGSPKNIGYPINTPNDDIDFSISADGKRLYFSAIRPEGYGDKDLYYAEMNVRESDLYAIKGKITDKENKTPIEAMISVYEKGEKNNLLRLSSSNYNTGKYTILLDEDRNYEIVINADGYQEISFLMNIKDLEGYHEENKDIYLIKQ